MKLDDRLVYEILSVVAEIPYGHVATYGQIANLIGRERNSRLVGKVLSMSELYGEYPCHRVVNRFGGTCPAFDVWEKDTQKKLLLSEGVRFDEEGRVDLSVSGWDGT